MNAKIKQDIEIFQAKLAVIKDEVKDDDLIVEQERINREFLSKQKVEEFVYSPFQDKEVLYDITRIKYDATIIKAAIKFNPKNISAYILQAFFTLSSPDINDINKALILNSDTKTSAALYVARAIPHWKKGDLNRALEDYNKAIQLDPKTSVYYKVRGDFYQNQLKDYDKAVADYATAIKLNPKDVDAYKARGELYESQEKYLEAIKDYQTALKLAPEKLDFDYNKIGDMYKELNDYPRALEYYTKAINQELDPKYAFADTRAATYLNRAQIYMEQEDYDKAIADCDKGLELARAALGKSKGTGIDSLLKDSYDGFISMLEETRQAALEAKNFTDKHDDIDLNNIEALMERANSNVEKAIYDSHNKYPQESLKRAIEDYTRVLKLDPKNQLALEKRAWTYCTVGEYKLSVADYDKLIKLNPKSVDFWSNRGWAYEKLGELDKALADYDKCIELNPNNEFAKEHRKEVLVEINKNGNKEVKILMEQADSFQKDKDYTRAAEYYTQVLSLNPNYQDAYFKRGLTYIYMKKYDLAVADYNKLLELNPTYYTSAYNNRGVAYKNLKEYDKAVADFTRALEMDSTNKHATKNRGDCYREQKNYSQALEDYTQALSIDSNYQDAYFWRAWIYGELKNYEKALTDWNRLIELNPNYGSNAYNNRGWAYEKLGELDKALADYDKAIELNPSDIAKENRQRVLDKLKK